MTTIPDGITKWIRELHATAGRIDRDNVILCCGREGMGKSTAAVQLALEADPAFTVDNIVYSGAQLARLAHELPRNSVVLLDESSNGANSREAMTRENRDLVKFLQTGRYLNHTYILCFPNLKWLDAYIKDHRAEWLVLVRKRGSATIHKGAQRDFKVGNRPWPVVKGFNFGAAPAEIWEPYTEKKEREARLVVDEAAGIFAPDPDEVRRLSKLLSDLMKRHA